MNCSDCARPLKKSKSGKCRPCFARGIARDRSIRARAAEAMVKRWADPEYSRRVGNAISSAHLTRIANDPQYAEDMRRRGLAMNATLAGRDAARSPEARKRLSESLKAAKIAWCPEHLRPLYADLKRRLPARLARARIEKIAGNVAKKGDDPALVNTRFLVALYTYGTKRGLPNLSANDCAERLRSIAA